MTLRVALFSLSLLALPGFVQAADKMLAVEDGKFTPETLMMNKGDKLVVTNNTQKKPFIWGQRGNYSFDFRATKEDSWTHEPGQSLGIVINEPGKYFIGNTYDGTMQATVIVGQ
jgi:plastocyanin